VTLGGRAARPTTELPRVVLRSGDRTDPGLLANLGAFPLIARAPGRAGRRWARPVARAAAARLGRQADVSAPPRGAKHALTDPGFLGVAVLAQDAGQSML